MNGRLPDSQTSSLCIMVKILIMQYTDKDYRIDNNQEGSQCH
jgi:hypothetical protein